MITQRATLVGILGFCLYLIAFVNVLPSFYLLTWLAVGILFSSLGIALLSLVGLDCQWHVAQARVVESLAETPDLETGSGDLASPAYAERERPLTGPLLEVKLANAGTLNKINVLLEVCLDCPARDEVLTRRFLLEALPSGASLASTLPLTHLPRGRYQVRELRLVGSDVLGLFRIHKRLTRRVRRDDAVPAQSGEDGLIVGPAMISRREAGLRRGTGEQVGSAGMSRLLGHSDDIRGTRPYAAGDDLRRVHWRSTARHGRLIVKEFHHAAQSQALIIWDGAHDAGAGEEASPVLESGLRLAASVCRVLSEAGQRYTLVRMDSHPALVTSTELSVASAASLSRVIETLADAAADRTQSLAHALAPFLGSLQQVHEVFLVTASDEADVRPVAEYWRAHGARVTVGLLGGGDAGQRQAGVAARPRWRWRRPARTVAAGADYGGLGGLAARPRSLEDIGVQVVAWSPTPPGDDALSALRRTLGAMLERLPHEGTAGTASWRNSRRRHVAEQAALMTPADHLHIH